MSENTNPGYGGPPPGQGGMGPGDGAPRSGGFDGPRPGGFDGPRPGGFDGPRSGGFDGPRSGGFDGPRGPGGPGGRPMRPKGKYAPRRKVCAFCVDKVTHIDYKDLMRLRRFLSDRAKIEPARKTGTCAKHQRRLATALKRARHLALLPY